MVKTLIVSHGELSLALLRAAERIAGANPCLSALSLDWDDDLVKSRRKIRRAIAAAGPEEGVLILTDMFGGTPYNAAAALVEPGRVEVVAGVNLPMVLRLECLLQSELGPAELAEWIEAKGKASVCRSLGSRARTTVGAEAEQ